MLFKNWCPSLFKLYYSTEVLYTGFGKMHNFDHKMSLFQIPFTSDEVYLHPSLSRLNLSPFSWASCFGIRFVQL